MRHLTLEEIKQKALPILTEAEVKKSSIFGSYSRGEQKEDSDIDMLVELPNGKSMFDLIRLERKLKRALGRDVDLLTYNSIHPLLKTHIQKNQFQIL